MAKDAKKRFVEKQQNLDADKPLSNKAFQSIALVLLFPVVAVLVYWTVTQQGIYGWFLTPLNNQALRNLIAFTGTLVAVMIPWFVIIFPLKKLSSIPPVSTGLREAGYANVKEALTDAFTTKGQSLKKFQDSPQQKNFSISTHGQKISQMHIKIGAALVVVTAMIPALASSGFFAIFSFSFEVYVVIAGVGGVIAGGVVSHGHKTPLWVGGISGIVVNLGILFATHFYLGGREEIISIELALPLLFGALPGFLCYTLLKNLVARK